MSVTTPFEPARHLTRISGSDYLEVKWRLSGCATSTQMRRSRRNWCLTTTVPRCSEPWSRSQAADPRLVGAVNQPEISGTTWRKPRPKRLGAPSPRSVSGRSSAGLRVRRRRWSGRRLSGQSADTVWVPREYLIGRKPLLWRPSDQISRPRSGSSVIFKPLPGRQALTVQLWTSRAKQEFGVLAAALSRRDASSLIDMIQSQPGGSQLASSERWETSSVRRLSSNRVPVFVVPEP